MFYKVLLVWFSAISVFSASSMFQFYLHKLYNMPLLFIISVRYSVILFSLYKKQFVKTNIM